MGNTGCSAKTWLMVFTLFVLGTVTPRAFSKSSAFPVYEDSFDLAAGGASLTKATQEGVLFSNPAQLAYAGTILRWIGLKTTMYASRSSVNLVKNIAGANQKKGAEGEGGSSSTASEAIDQLSNSPVHFGAGLATSFLTGLFGIGLVSRLGPDIEFSKIGGTGLPEFDLAAEVYGAVGAGAAFRLLPWLSLGLTTKIIAASEPELVFDISQQGELQSIANEGGSSIASLQIGKGADLGSLMLFRGPHMDFGFAYKIDDVGDTQFSGSGYPKSFPQSQSVGTSLTFHNSTDAIHLALDYRDLTDAYHLPTYKKVSAGVKVTFPDWVGLAAGVRDGSPCYGAYANLLILKIGATTYARELGDSPGVRRRRVYMLSLATGVSF